MSPPAGDRLGDRVADLIGVVGPVDRVGRAQLAGEPGRAGGTEQSHLVVLLDDIDNGEGDRRIGDVEDGIDAILLEPLLGDCRADVGLLLMVGVDDLDVEPGIRVFLHEVFDRELGAGNETKSARGRVDVREVAEHAELDGSGDAVGQRRRCCCK